MCLYPKFPLRLVSMNRLLLISLVFIPIDWQPGHFSLLIGKHHIGIVVVSGQDGLERIGLKGGRK